ncbi:MAG TPA: acyltransferase family protein [Thermodesulfovibrionales bacterium]|nr:acyltransferase family protein [Thermodesulfovibrionales bacterium]
MPPAETRVIYFDNIRSLMVLCVVIVHSAAAYTNTIPWWYVRNSQTSTFFDLLVFVLDIFQMPVIFFIAGYFTLPSLLTRGVTGFILSKLKRLGIPLVLIGCFFSPIMPYIHYRLRTDGQMRFLEYWLHQMKTILPVGFVHASSAMEIEQHFNDFDQQHLWFISLLLLFFVISALVIRIMSKLKPDVIQSRSSDPVPVNPSMIWPLFITGVAAGSAFGLIGLYSQDGSWLKFGGLLLFQPTRLPVYIGMFALGIYAYGKQLLDNRRFPVSWSVWLSFTLALTLLFLVHAEKIYTKPVTIVQSLAHGYFRAFLCLAYLGVFVSSGNQQWNRSANTPQSLAVSSYDIYLIHLPIVVIVQLVFLPLPVSIFLKGGFIAAFTVFLCWRLSSKVILPYPKAAAMALLGVFLIALLVV